MTTKLGDMGLQVETQGTRRFREPGRTLVRLAIRGRKASRKPLQLCLQDREDPVGVV